MRDMRAHTMMSEDGAYLGANNCVCGNPCAQNDAHYTSYAYGGTCNQHVGTYVRRQLTLLWWLAIYFILRCR